jgi:ubiquinone/menaquinone biosynthesis C-methylase UbiE
MSIQDERLSEMRDFYDNVYYKNVSGGCIENSHLRKLAKRIGIKKGDKVLDIACGEGGWLLSCSNFGALPSGIDLSEKAISTCKQCMPDGEFYSLPAESLPFGSHQFDVVTCLGSIEHFVEPEKALMEMARVGKKKRCFYFSCQIKIF